jgi:hypothetical protein
MKIMNVARRYGGRIATGSAILVASIPAFASDSGTGSGGFDVSSATDFISGDLTSGITAVGGAIIAVAALAMGFKWIKGALFS